MKRLFPILCVFSCLIAAQSFAASATWSANPISGDWNTAENWIPNTVPNGPGDTATFDVSTITNVSTSTQTEVDSIVFNPGASAYTITLKPVTQQFLFITGAGIVNSSGVLQTFVGSEDRVFHAFDFFNNSTAGDLTVFHNQSIIGSVTNFLGASNAGSCTIINQGSPGAAGGQVEFFGISSAANATIINEGAPPGDVIGGATYFFDNASAGTATIINEGGTVADGGGGLTMFDNDATTAAGATVINNGGSVEGALGGHSDFILGATPGNATFIANGTFAGYYGAGRIYFQDSVGGAPRIELFGTGTLDLSTRYKSDLTVGSIEGDGLVFLGAIHLIVGSNNLSTVFSGVIQDGGIVGGTHGSFAKIGTASLTVTGANTYTGDTTIEGGNLIINNKTGSATGGGAVLVNAGRLAGRGTIAGVVVVGDASGRRAALAPGRPGGKPDSLTIQGALTFNYDGSYQCGLNSKSAATDKIVANGVIINGGQFSLRDRERSSLNPGTVLTVIDNTSANSISGTFANLPDNSTFTVGQNTYQVSYSGGDGNDLTLTVVP
jgi:autotransporter-associated beta strand protein